MNFFVSMIFFLQKYPKVLWFITFIGFKYIFKFAKTFKFEAHSANTQNRLVHIFFVKLEHCNKLFLIGFRSSSSSLLHFLISVLFKITSSCFLPSLKTQNETYCVLILHGMKLYTYWVSQTKKTEIVDVVVVNSIMRAEGVVKGWRG